VKKNRIYLLLLGTIIALTFCINYASASEADYKGAAFCGNCHPDVYQAWLETPHAKAVVLENGTYLVHGERNQGDLASFENSCANCHTLGWNGTTKTFAFSDTDPSKGLGIQCEECHGPYQSHSANNPAMTINYDADACAKCHTQPADHALSRHSTSMQDLGTSSHASDSCLHCMSTQGFIGLSVTLSDGDLTSLSCVACHDPHSFANASQLRADTVNDLCAECHTGHHPQSDIFMDSALSMANVSCTDCHGAGTRLAHGQVGVWFNHSFAIYNTFYPYNQSEPMVCSNCHDLTWATERLAYIETLTSEHVENATAVVQDAITTIKEVNATEGVDSSKIVAAMSRANEAQGIINTVVLDNSGGLHNTEEIYTLLSNAVQFAGEAKSEALDAQFTTLSNSVQSLTSQVSTLQAQVTDLQGTASGLTTNLIIGAVVGLVIGAAVVFFITKKQ
jgi:predicted CXXCH cytochrome family protein